MKRNYGQMCGVAASMSVLGERWTILIIRELLLGPMRFQQLQDNLPGIGPNLLTARLNHLRETGLICQLPVKHDARGKSYSLTKIGEDLRQPILQLAKWGLQFISPTDEGEVRGQWAFVALQALVSEAAIPSVTETYHFHVGEADVSVIIDNGSVTFHRGPAIQPPAVSVNVPDPRTFIRIGARLQSPLSAIATGNVHVEGDPAAIERCLDVLGLNDQMPTKMAPSA